MDELMGYSPELLRTLGVDLERLKQQQQTQGLLSAGLQLLASSGYSPVRRTTGELLGQAGAAGLQGYQQAGQSAIDSALRNMQVQQALAKANQPEYKTIKTASGGEAFVMMPRGGGAPQLVPIPGLSTAKPIEFDNQTQAFINLKFKKPYEDLSDQEKVEVLSFSNAPNAEKETTLRIEGEKQRFETGVTTPIPRGRSDFLRPILTPATQAPVAREPVKTTTLPQIPVAMATKPMGEKEAPLVESTGVSPKQKQELLMARPQTQSSVEYVVNTNRAMQSLIDEILADPGLNDAFGFGGETISKVPGSPAANVRAKLERLGGNMFIEAITALRNASKNGAGVGNATEKEGDKLERSRANLQQFQTVDAAKTELQRLKKSLEESESNVLTAYERTYGKGTFNLAPVEIPKDKRPPLTNIFGMPR